MSIDLLVVSHVVHYRKNGALFAYGPYVLEMDMWAQIFDRIVIAAPCRNELPPDDCVPFASTGIAVHTITETGGERLAAKLKQLLMVPKLVVELWAVMKKADAIHVRCPGNLGLLGAVLAPLFTERRIAKYAGQWTGFAGEPKTVALQRWLLRSRWWGAPVTVYGAHYDEPPHVVPFFTSILDDAQMARARNAAVTRRPLNGSDLHVVYVGRLSQQKNVDVLIKAVAALRQEGLVLDCTIIGDGAEGPALRLLASTSAAADRIHFTGAVPLDDVLAHYEKTDVLVLASSTEGWGKSIVEAMAFGVICIGSSDGPVPEMFSHGRGLTIRPRDTTALADHLRAIALDPAKFMDMRKAAATWGQQFSLSGLRNALSDLLDSRWHGGLRNRAAQNPASCGVVTPASL
jgi:glycosyltransferase involved in cell wall biosynthesis